MVNNTNIKDKEELVIVLKKLINANRLKIRDVEKSLRFPINGLSRYLNGYELPHKWIDPIADYIKLIDPGNRFTKKQLPEWAKELELYCQQEGISPSELMRLYKLSKNSKKSVTDDKAAQEVKLNIDDRKLSHHELAMRKKTLGY